MSAVFGALRLRREKLKQTASPPWDRLDYGVRRNDGRGRDDGDKSTRPCRDGLLCYFRGLMLYLYLDESGDLEWYGVFSGKISSESAYGPEKEEERAGQAHRPGS